MNKIINKMGDVQRVASLADQLDARTAGVTESSERCLKDFTYQCLQAVEDSATFCKTNMEAAFLSGLKSEAHEWQARYREASIIRKRIIDIIENRPISGRPEGGK